MSYSESDMKSIGETNAGWGVCGFTSSLYAMYHLNPASRRFLIAAPQAWSVIYEIQDYLESLIQQNEAKLIDSIEKFTRTFGNGAYKDFSVEGYLKYIKQNWEKYATPASGDINTPIMSDGKFSIAMPPHAVVDYLKRMWKIDSKLSATSSASDGIVGVKDPSDKTMVLYDGLRHYLYQKNGKVYSWGQTFSSVLEAGKKFAGRNYVTCAMITF